MALWALRSQLSAEQATYWSDAITGGANYLIAAGNLTFYTNGNVNVGIALAMELAYCASGESQYQTDYEVALSFAIAPPQGRAGQGSVSFTRRCRHKRMDRMAPPTLPNREAELQGSTPTTRSCSWISCAVSIS